MSKIAGELNAEMSKTIGSKEYNEWLNSPLTKALKRSFEQSITDPENQPSQYGTVTLAMYEHLEEQITASQQRVAELEKQLESAYKTVDANWVSHQQLVKLTSERDALKQQRDELLAALGSGGRHCNDDTPHSNLCEAIIDSKEADLGQGLDPFWKWAFRRGFHEAETSYKVDIATLEQQRDELLAAAEAIEINAEECLDFDECTTMLVQIDDYHKLMEAIASVKEKA